MSRQRILSRSGIPLPWGEFTLSAGDYEQLRPLFKFGFNGDVDAGEETIWDQGGVYSFPSTATAMTVSSDDANDTAAGTGARTVQWFGLDTDYVEVDETVTLNGTTAVATTTEFLRVFRGIVRTAGSGGTNAGNLFIGTGTVTLGEPANVFARISAGEAQTLMAVYTIPANHIGFLTQIYASLQGNSSATAEIRFRVRPENQVFQTKDKFDISQAGGPVQIPHILPDPFPAKSDILLNATGSTTNLTVTGHFEMVLARV